VIPEPSHGSPALAEKLDSIRSKVEAKRQEFEAATRTWNEEELWLWTFKGTLDQWIVQIKQHPRPAEYKKWRREIKNKLRETRRTIRSDPRFKTLENECEFLRRKIRRKEADYRKAAPNSDLFWYLVGGVVILMILVFVVLLSSRR
jgi:hypothetical protein